MQALFAAALFARVAAGSVADVTTYTAYVNNLGAGTAGITLRNLTAATSQSEAVVVNFALIHCD